VKEIAMAAEETNAEVGKGKENGGAGQRRLDMWGGKKGYVITAVIIGMLSWTAYTTVNRLRKSDRIAVEQWEMTERLREKNEAFENKSKNQQAAPQTDGLQGRWQVLAMRQGAREAPENVLSEMSYTFTESEMTINGPQLGTTESKVVSRYTIDTTEIPYKLDLEQQPGTPGSREAEPVVIRGIYKLDGDSLTICLNSVGPDDLATDGGVRPTSFDWTDENGESGFMIEMTRAKASDEDTRGL